MKSKNLNSKLKVAAASVVLLASLGCIPFLPQGAQLFAPTTLSADTVNSTSQGTWGSALWTLEDGTLTLAGGIAGPYLTLSETLEENGIDLAKITSLKISGSLDVRDVPWAFANFPNLKSIEGLANLYCKGDVQGLFANNPSLESIDMDALSNTFYIKNTSKMFYNDTSLKYLRLPDFSYSSVTDVSYMFANTGIEQLSLTSGFIGSETKTEGMLSGATDLNSLTLEEGVPLKPDMALPSIEADANYTGYWTNAPAFTGKWTSEELMADYDPSTMWMNTYIWQAR